MTEYEEKNLENIDIDIDGWGCASLLFIGVFMLVLTLAFTILY